MKLILQIALGVSLGIVLGGSLLFLYTGALTEQINTALKQSVIQNTSVSQSSQPIDRLLSSNPPTITQSQIASEPAKPNTVPSVNTAPEPNAAINTAGKELSAAIAEKDDQTQMEIAFKRSYKKPAKCWSHHENHDLLVTCGNEYIRARDKFEELWKHGAFKNDH